ncbi:MAG TPA: YdeI/OmpD-associated family protein [Cyclobacteriaceae bacterium]
MGKRSARVDDYIINSPEFARPILEHLRELVHQACPQVEESIKWGVPSFEYKGLLFGFAAFKAHCGFGFWKFKLLKDPKDFLNSNGAMTKVKSIKDLPPNKVILDFIRQAKKLNNDGVKLPSRTKKVSKPIIVPTYFSKVLQSNKIASATFRAFSPSHRREYIEWITEAKTETTREKRLKTTLEWLEQGKPRNWKYMKK